MKNLEDTQFPAPRNANGAKNKNNDTDRDPKKFLGAIIAALLVGMLINTLFLSKGVENITYSEFLKLLENGEVVSAVIGETTINGDLKPLDVPTDKVATPQAENASAPSPETATKSKARRFTTHAVKDDTLVAKLTAKGVHVRGEVRNPMIDFLLAWILPGLLLYWIWTMASGRMLKGAGGLLSMTKSRAKVFIEKDVKTVFADVAGIDEAKEELLEVVSFLKDPKRYARLGGRAPKGVLLVGPPGTGKTLLARAVAGEAQVPFFSINGSEFVEMFVGLGAARVRDLFEQARSQAPCILFIDEIDALGKSRALGFAGGGANDEKEQTLNQLLAEMDGFDPSEGVIMLAATNRPEILDPALLRAGRFDRQVMLNNPDQMGRQQILNVHVKKIKLAPQVNLHNVASLTSGFSGADLANLVNEAALVATRRNAEAVTEADFSQAIERIIAGLEKKGKVMNPQEKTRVAFHELGHATVAMDLNCLDKVHKISIIPRGMGALGYTLQRPTEDRYLLDEDELMNKAAVLLGGRAAEKIFLGKVSTGAADDLAKATDLVRAMITQFGMSEKLGLAALERRSSAFLQSPFESPRSGLSEKTAGEIDVETKELLGQAFQVASQCLERNRAFIREAHDRLLSKETLTEDEISGLWKNHHN